VTGPGWLGQVWSQTSRRLRVSSIVLLVAALAGTAAGVVGDQRGWWADHDFLVNLVSSLVSALFGLPVALIVIRHFTATEGRRLERAEAVRLGHSSARRLADVVTSLCPDRVLAADNTATLRRLSRDLLPAVPSHRYGPALADVLTQYVGLVDGLDQVVRTGSPARDPLREADAAWRYLRSDIAPRLQSYGISWIPGVTADRVGRLLADAGRLASADLHDVTLLAEAARRTLSTGDSAPLATLYEDEYAVLGGIQEQIDFLLAGISAVVELLDTADRLDADLTVIQRNM